MPNSQPFKDWSRLTRHVVQSGIGIAVDQNLRLGDRKRKFRMMMQMHHAVVTVALASLIEAGIETIYQNTALVDSLSITRNIFMGRERCASGGMLKLGEMRDISMEVLKSAVHISGIDTPDMLVGELSGGQKQAVAIARAVFFKRRILMLDEPTSALSVRETEALLNQVLKLKSENVSSVFVTHNLYHAYQVCDRFVIMSHGTKVFDVAKADTSIGQLTEYVVLT